MNVDDKISFPEEQPLVNFVVLCYQFTVSQFFSHTSPLCFKLRSYVGKVFRYPYRNSFLSLTLYISYPSYLSFSLDFVLFEYM